MSEHFLSNYIYAVFKRLRLISIICFLSLTSNIVGNFVCTRLDDKSSITLSEEDETEERDSDTDENNNGSSKRGVNFLEEELHLAENTPLSNFDIDFNLLRKSTFSAIIAKPACSGKAPLDNPPEIGTNFS